MLSRVLLLALLACGATLGFAQSRLSGEGRYPQFRGLSGLPGSGSGVTVDGRFSIDGALAYSTPVAFTPGSGSFAASVGLLSRNRQPVFVDGDGKDSNGTGSFLFGLDLWKGRLAGGAMLLSQAKDSALTIQYGMTFEDKYGVAVGVQDINGGGGAAGEGQPTDRMSSSSVYGVASARLTEKVHASAGIGNRRFRFGFANVSASLTPNVKAVLEHDGFGFNYGLAYGTRSPANSRSVNATVFLGLVQGRHACWSLSFSF